MAKNGGRRPGSGRKPVIAGTRAWLRKITSTPELKEQVVAAIQASVAKGDLTDWWKAVEHGFGRAPMSMDVRTTDNRDTADTRDFWAEVEALSPEVTSTVSSPTTH